ncbi:MAG: hypothetical protein VYC82_07715, partial [Verrucomicrobiota bacterium]|nr:hypothetical protein [Verrucomicrobiota bacterium]
VSQQGFSNRFPHVPLVLLAFQHIYKPNYLLSTPRQATIHIPNESGHHSIRFLRSYRRFMVALATKLVTSSQQ